MDLTNIRTFLKVSELKNFSQAASSLGYAQSTVSTQIARLEQELGEPLFERLGHRISLTEKGIVFLQYAKQMQLLAEKMQNDLNDTQRTRWSLRIAMADSLCASYFPPYLLAYQKLYPEVSVFIQTGTTERMFNALVHNEVDMVYTLDNRVLRTDYIAHQEKKERVLFCTAVNHPLAHRIKQNPAIQIPWAEIKKYPLYLTEEGVSYRGNLERILGNMGEELRPALELANAQILLDLTARSEGITFLPEFALADYLKQGKITILPVKDIDVYIWRQLIYHKGKYLTPAMQGMIDLLQKTP